MKAKSQATKYKKHIFKYIDEIVDDFEKQTLADMKRMKNVLKPILISLSQNGFNKLKNITKLLKSNGFKSKSIKQVILFLEDSLEKNTIPRREINKLNSTYQNTILNSIFYNFPDDSIQLIDDYVTKKCPFIGDHDSFMSVLRRKINKIQSSSKIIEQKKEIKDHLVISEKFDTDVENNINIVDTENINLNAAAESIDTNYDNLSLETGEINQNYDDYFIDMNNKFDLNSQCFYL